MIRFITRGIAALFSQEWELDETIQKGSKIFFIALLSLIVILSFPFIMAKKEYKKYPAEQDIELQISAEALGFSQTIESESSLYSFMMNVERIGTIVETKIHEQGKSMNITVIQFYDEAFVHDAFIYQVEKIVTSLNKSFVSSKRHYMPTVKIERIIEKSTLLDVHEWNAVSAFALNPLNEEENVLCIEQQNQIVIIELYGLSLTKEREVSLRDTIHQISIQVLS